MNLKTVEAFKRQDRCGVIRWDSFRKLYRLMKPRERMIF